MRERARRPSDASRRAADRGRPPSQAGATLLDVVVASVVLLLILIPATQLLVTSGKVVTNSKAQAVAESVAGSQLETDRATFLANPGAQPFTASTCAGSSYAPSTTNATFAQYLTACVTAPANGGAPLWVFQRGGWCVANGTTLGSGSTGTPMYWVSVMVTWGGSAVPASTTVVPASNRVVFTSALQTPAGYTVPAGPWSCPL
jgi:hypothetical protein